MVIAAEMCMSMMVMVTVVMTVHTYVVVIKMTTVLILMVIVNISMRLALTNSLITISIITVSSTRCHSTLLARAWLADEQNICAVVTSWGRLRWPPMTPPTMATTMGFTSSTSAA